MSDKTPNDGSLQSTKQMLDELDAMMEKMLTVPVSDLDEAVPFPPPIVKTPALSATLTLLEPTDSAPSPDSKKPPPARNRGARIVAVESAALRALQQFTGKVTARTGAIDE